MNALMCHHGLLLLSFIFLLLGAAGMTAEEGWAHAEKVLREYIKAPTFPDSDRSIADFGAVGDARRIAPRPFGMRLLFAAHQMEAASLFHQMAST